MQTDFCDKTEQFGALLSWIEANPKERIRYLSRLMERIQFSLNLENDLINELDASSEAQIKFPYFYDLMKESILYHLLQYRRKLLTTSNNNLTKSIKGIISCGGLALKKQGCLSDKVFFCDVETGNWEALTSLPEALYHHAVAVKDDVLYVAGGNTSESCDEISRKFWTFDPKLNEWFRLPDMMLPRECFQIVFLKHSVYAAGGRTNGATTGSVEKFDLKTDQWTEVTSLSSPRRHVALASTEDGYLWAAGGLSDEVVTRRFEMFNSTSLQWERKQPLNKARFSATLSFINNKLWLVGGATIEANDPSASVVGADEIEVYDFLSDQWTIYDPLSCKISATLTPPTSECVDSEIKDSMKVQTTRSEYGACRNGDTIYLVGGYGWNKKVRLNDVELISTSNEEVKSIIQEYPIQCTGLACGFISIPKKYSIVKNKEASCEGSVKRLRKRFENGNNLTAN